MTFANNSLERDREIYAVFARYYDIEYLSFYQGLSVTVPGPSAWSLGIKI